MALQATFVSRSATTYSASRKIFTAHARVWTPAPVRRVGLRRCRVRAPSSGYGDLSDERERQGSELKDTETIGSSILVEDPHGYELEGCWVLKPEGNSRKGVIHFLGGAFVGANPQISYSTLLEELSSLGFIVISTPYELTFNHSTCAFTAATKFDRCLEKLCIHPMGGGMPTEGFQELPIYTLGHSNGSLLHLLASSLESCAETSYSCVQRSVLMSYNNKPVEEAVPGGVPSGVSPLASQLLEYQSLLTPQIQEFMPMITDTPLGKQLLPYVNQLNQSVGELAEGTREFEPTPGESREIIKDGYCVPETLLVRFTDDSFDQSSEMANILSLSQKVANVELDEISGLGHLTPLGTTLEWEVGDKFTPLDAIAQAIRGEGTKRARSLALRISEWLLDAES